MTTGPSGGSGTGPPKALGTFELLVVAVLLVLAVWAVKAANANLTWPSAMVAGFGFGIYILARVAATRRLS